MYEALVADYFLLTASTAGIATSCVASRQASKIAETYLPGLSLATAATCLVSRAASGRAPVGMFGPLYLVAAS